MLEAIKITAAGSARGAYAAIGLEIDEALRDGLDPEPLRAKRTRLKGYFDSVPDMESADEIIGAYPSDLLPPLPLWIVDPEAAAELDPPGEVLVVGCALPPPDPEPTPVEEMDIEELRALRLAFVEGERVQARDMLDERADEFKSARAIQDLAQLRADIDQRAAERVAAIEAADTVEALRNL